MEKLGNKFIIVVPCYNVENLIESSIRSIIAQSFEDVGIIIRDDMSTDRSPDIVADLFQINGIDEIKTTFLGRDVLFIRNQQKFYGAGNTYDSATNYVNNPESIIGTVDGDDMLIDIHTLAKVNQIYQDKQVWQVWSQHQAISRIQKDIRGWSAPLPSDKEIYDHRNYWSVSHFRTCKAWLFDYLQQEDLRDPFLNQPYCQYAGDASLTYALTELCGNERSYFLDEILYLYNDNLALNDHNIGLKEQEKYATYLRRSQRKYEKLISNEPALQGNFPIHSLVGI